MPDVLRHVKWWQLVLALIVALMIIGAVARDGDQGTGGQTPVTAPPPQAPGLGGN